MRTGSCRTFRSTSIRVPCSSSTAMRTAIRPKAWEQLRRMGIQGELHTLAKRPHCFQSKAAPGTGSYTYLDRIWEFMNHKGYNK